MSLLLRQLKSLDGIVAEYGEEVEALAATPRYQEPVKALTCYKGIKNLFALTMITEIGHRYREFLEAMAHWRAEFPHRVIEIQYEALVENVSAEARRLIEALGATGV